MEIQPWDRQPNESLLWYRRFTAYRLMTPVRKIPLVFQQEQQTKEENRGKQRTEPPGVWWEVAKKWKWNERVATWDKCQAEELEREIAAEEKKILREEYALRHKRIEELNRIVKKLIGYLEDENNIWLPDVKAIGTGPNARQVDLIRFNDAIFSEIRAHFDDIAKEKGERVKKQELSVKELPKLYIDLAPDEDGIDP
jgi:hypothetical protein